MLKQFLSIMSRYLKPYRKFLAWAVALNFLSQWLNVFSFVVLILNRAAFAGMIGILAVQTVIETIRTRRLKADDHIYRNANERYTGFVSEMIRGAKDVKLTHSEDTFETELVRRIVDANSKRMRMQNRSAVFQLFRMDIGSFGTYGYIAVK